MTSHGLLMKLVTTEEDQAIVDRHKVDITWTSNEVGNRAALAQEERRLIVDITWTSNEVGNNEMLKEVYLRMDSR